MNESDQVPDEVFDKSSSLLPSNEISSQSGEVGLFTQVVQFLGEPLQQLLHRPHDEDDKWAMARSLGKGFFLDEVSRDEQPDDFSQDLTQVMETFEDSKNQDYPDSVAS
ncbi:MAG: hypothetical protein K2X66_01060 [Cyanobacteria bacterium]|nr:hypothetical protein [Cyanobacteriota bacterium]